MNYEWSKLIIFMKVGDYGPESLPEIMSRIKALYEYEKQRNKNAFYPFGYKGAYTAYTLRDILAKCEEKGLNISNIDVLFSPTNAIDENHGIENWAVWRRACQMANFPSEFNLGPKTGAWKYMDRPINKSHEFPSHYPTSGDEGQYYYGLIIKNLELFTNPVSEIRVDLSLYRRLSENPRQNMSELDGGQWRLSAIPCLYTNEPANKIRLERVIARAKLVDPFAVELSPTPFE